MMKRKILILYTLLALLAGILGAFLLWPRIPTQAHATGTGTDWTMFQGDLGHSGFNGAETVLNASTARLMKVEWTRHEGSGISSQVTAANGLIYWGSWDGLEHASNPADGTDVWATNLGTTTPPPTQRCYPPSAGPSGAAAIETISINGTMTSVAFVSGGDATLYALNATTGAILWNTRLGTSPSHMLWAGPVFYKGDLYVGVSSYGDCPLIQGQVIQLAASTGTVLHTFKTVPDGCISGGVWDTPTIDQQTGMLYASTGTQSSCKKPGNLSVGLIELNTTDLSLVSSWVVPPSQLITDSDFGSTPTLFQATIGGVLHQMVGLVNKNGIYYAFDRSNIAAGPLWQVRLSNVGGGNSFASSGWDGSTLYEADSSTTINGKSCVGSLRALNPATGAFLWQTCLASRVFSSVMIVPGLVVVGAGNSIIVAKSASGKQTYKFQDPTKNSARFVSSATIVNGRLYMGSLDGNLFALGL
ncbi:MAG: PQQ-binding-like beta-propeller repeat protein [Ktedonobacteraceae bacterium]